MFVAKGTVVFGFEADLIINEQTMRTIDYIISDYVRGAHPDEENLIPEKIVFWSVAEFPEGFDEIVNNLLEDIAYMYKVDFRNSIEYVTFNKVDPNFTKDLIRLLSGTYECVHFLSDHEGAVHEIRSLYEEIYRHVFSDVYFFTFGEEGRRSFIHTPYLVREVSLQ